jgi:hypothetical protein
MGSPHVAPRGATPADPDPRCCRHPPAPTLLLAAARAAAMKVAAGPCLPALSFSPLPLSQQRPRPRRRGPILAGGAWIRRRGCWVHPLDRRIYGVAAWSGPRGPWPTCVAAARGGLCCPGARSCGRGRPWRCPGWRAAWGLEVMAFFNAPTAPAWPGLTTVPPTGPVLGLVSARPWWGQVAVVLFLLVPQPWWIRLWLVLAAARWHGQWWPVGGCW